MRSPTSSDFSFGGCAFVQLKRALLGLGCLAGGSLAGWIGGAPPTRLTFLSVGQGDCTVFQHAGTTVLIDGGPQTPYFDAGDRIVVPKLESLGVRGVDLIVITHPDQDHVGGIGAILKQYPTAKLLVSEAFQEHPGLAGRFESWGRTESDVMWIPTGALAKVGEFSIEFAAREPAPGSPDNDGSIFVRISGQGASAVISGDAPQEVETIVASQGNWKAQVMTAGHHGSATATSGSWIREVQPHYAVISCGRDNTYGHPAAPVLDRLESAGIEVFRTDRLGDVKFDVRVGQGFVPIR